jgi:LuxR family maltose regulon positive regulatory protein
MKDQLLKTKIYIPPPKPKDIHRPLLIKRLNEGLDRKLSLISAPAGFGKTTLVSSWAVVCNRPVAWLSLNQMDNDPINFLIYLIAATQTIVENFGEQALPRLRSPQPPSLESILVIILNEFSTLKDNIILVLDDYHIIDAKPVDSVLSYLLSNLPPQLHLVISTREDPNLPLAGLRAQRHLNELRAEDLRFNQQEAAEFFKKTMGLSITPDDISALEARTEGWIAGIQLAAISMKGYQDTTQFISSFTGSHQYVMDYLVEEVLQQQPESIKKFLFSTSILDRMCGPLCEAVTLGEKGSGQKILENLERANLFIIPLDNQRKWYRYHHLFSDLLRHRLVKNFAFQAEDADDYNELYIRASEWYEKNGFALEAFQHAAEGNDIERALRLIGEKSIPRHYSGTVTAILNWLGSLPETEFNDHPSLWLLYASTLLTNGQTTGVEDKLQYAEKALKSDEKDNNSRMIIGRIAAARATLALTRYDISSMIAESRRALKYLHPENFSHRSSANWALGYGYMFQGDRSSARQVFTDAISLSQKSGDIFTEILATIGLGTVQEADNLLYQAVETYQHVLQLASEQPLQIVNEAHLGLARILYEWNDLEAAEKHGRLSLQLALEYDKVIDRYIICEIFLARLKLANNNVEGAAAILEKASQTAHQKNFTHRIPEIAAVQVLTSLAQGNLSDASFLAHKHDLPLSQARVHMARGDISTALEVLSRWQQQVEDKDLKDEQLKVMILQAVAHHLGRDKDKAMQLLGDALVLAEPGGFVRIFVDEGLPMAELVSEASTQWMMPGYISKILAVFETEEQKHAGESSTSSQPLIEPLSKRELEVLNLIAQGLSNREISERLFLALSSVKGHNRNIFGKLGVHRRTEAVARARELGLL